MVHAQRNQKQSTKNVKKSIVSKGNTNEEKRVLKKKKQTPVFNIEFINAFREAYSNIIHDMTTYHVHHDDSACNYEFVLSRRTTKINDLITYMYQPPKDACNEGIVDEAYIMLFFDKSIKLTKADKLKMKEVMKEVEDTLVEDFAEIMELTGNKWFREIEDIQDFNSILDIKKPLHEIRNNNWKINFSPLNSTYYGFVHGWSPRKISEISGNGDDEMIKDSHEYVKLFKDKFEINVC